jgi:hypothetical protein
MARVLSHLFAILSLLCLGAGAASANWMGGFVLENGATAHLANLQHANLQFAFKVTNANGARFVLEAYENGAWLSDANWGGSPNYAAGTTGTHTNYITFGTGAHHVDQIEVRMFDPVTSTLLLKMRLPVDYTFGNNAVYNLRFSTTSPAWIRNGQNLAIDFDYQTNEGAGARVSARPFTGGSLTPGYGASGLTLLPWGTGTGHQTFQFTTGTHDVDAIRFQMWNAAQTTLLLEFFVPVDLHWGAVGISNLVFDPPFPESRGWNEQVTVDFDYESGDAAGCFLWAYGEDASHATLPNQASDGSMLLPMNGHITRHFTATAGEESAAFVRVSMDNHDHSAHLAVVTVPVAYHFGPNAIHHVTFTPASPAVLDLGEHVDVTFIYVNSQTLGARLQPLPYTYEHTSPSHGVSGSGIYPLGSGTGYGFVTILAGQTLITRVGVHMYDSNWVGPVFSNFRETAYTFAGTGGVTAVPDAVAPPALVLGQNYPNPFNPLTNIPLDLGTSAWVTVKLYDVRGRLVDTIADAVLPAGRTVLLFDGSELASGEYFYVAASPDGSQVRRLVLVK